MPAQFGALQTLLCRHKIIIFLHICSALLISGGEPRAQAAGAVTHASSLKVSWDVDGAVKHLISFDSKSLSELKRGDSREEDPSTGEMARWSGVLLQSLIERSVRDLPLESRAQVDLIVLRNTAGREALIPRSLVTKFPVLLAATRNGTALDGWHSVVPWSSRPKLRSEQLPLESFFMKGVTEVELANFRDRYKPFLLKRRTDPSALRGENLFLKNCVACHTASGSAVLTEITSESKARSLASGHPTVRGFRPLSARDQRAIQTYFHSVRAEKAQSAAAPDQVAKQ